MSEISKVHDWVLGDYSVEPPIPLPDSPFGSWKADENDRYSAQAVQYTLQYSQNVIELVHDTEEGPARSAQLAAAHSKSVLFPPVRLMEMAQDGLIHPDGEPYEYDGDGLEGMPGPGQIVDADGLRLDAELLRGRYAEALRQVGHIVTWEGEPPVVKWPFSEEFMKPGAGGFVPSPNAPKIKAD
ncbi:MAG TPA: hypothetical protein VLG11_05410 [Candidatus Saccharimonadales bacterium]|nr:hypothetical protein [Candidatus Saccharimonadales bacterium]